MFLFRKPFEAQMDEYLAQQVRGALSYDNVGCTRGEPVGWRGWNVDRHRVLLGHGEEAYLRAREAIEGWRVFPSEVATVCGSATPREGLSVAVLYWAAPFRLWLVMAARVVYLIDEREECDGRQVERFGFAYGTLADHPARGEERFLVEWDRLDDCVWYDLLAVSQPRHWLARLGYPYTRYEQARFRRLSGAAMEKAVRDVPVMGIRRQGGGTSRGEGKEDF